MLALYAAGLILLLMTQGIRRKHPGEAGHLACLLVLPLALFLMLVFSLASRETFRPLDGTMEERILTWWDTVWNSEQSEISDVVSGASTEKREKTVNLSILGEHWENTGRIIIR